MTAPPGCGERSSRVSWSWGLLVSKRTSKLPQCHHHQQPPFSTHERGTVACIRIDVGHGVVGNIKALLLLVYTYAHLSVLSTVVGMSSLPYCRGKDVARIDFPRHGIVDFDRQALGLRELPFQCHKHRFIYNHTYTYIAKKSCLSQILHYRQITLDQGPDLTLAEFSSTSSAPIPKP